MIGSGRRYQSVRNTEVKVEQAFFLLECHVIVSALVPFLRFNADPPNSRRRDRSRQACDNLIADRISIVVVRESERLPTIFQVAISLILELEEPLAQ